MPWYLSDPAGLTNNYHAVLCNIVGNERAPPTPAGREIIDARWGEVPTNTGDRLNKVHTLERQDRRWRDLRLEARFNSAELVLNKECFYDGTFLLPLVMDMVVDSISTGRQPSVVDTEVVESVTEYLDNMAQLTQGRRRSTGLDGGAQVGQD